MNTKDVDLNTGAVMIRYGKGGKTRMVFIGRTTPLDSVSKETTFSRGLFADTIKMQNTEKQEFKTPKKTNSVSCKSILTLVEISVYKEYPDTSNRVVSVFESNTMKAMPVLLLSV